MTGYGSSVSSGLQLGLDLRALVESLRTTCMESATGRRVLRTGHFADEQLLRPLGLDLRIRHGYRRHQRFGIGMLGLPKKLVTIGDLRDFAQVHDRNTVADMAHDREVMSDEEVGKT
jgi:hypothetical protein